MELNLLTVCPSRVHRIFAELSRRPAPAADSVVDLHSRVLLVAVRPVAALYILALTVAIFTALRGRPVTNVDRHAGGRRKARKMLEDGVGMLRIAVKLDVGSGTVQRIAQEVRR